MILVSRYLKKCLISRYLKNCLISWFVSRSFQIHQIIWPWPNFESKWIKIVQHRCNLKCKGSRGIVFHKPICISLRKWQVFHVAYWKFAVVLSPRNHLIRLTKKSEIVYEAGLKVIKLFSCSTQLNTKFILLINVKMPTIVGILTFISRINTTSKRIKARNVFICRYFSFYEQLKFCAQLSWAWKKIITSGPGL